MKASKGFTILELLVVVAIIAVVAGIILINAKMYSLRARDAAIHQYVNQMAIRAAEKFASDGQYGTYFGGNSYFEIVNKIFALNQGAGGCYALEAPLNQNYSACFATADTKGSICIDSKGANSLRPTTDCYIPCVLHSGFSFCP